jgi:DME family drug/metabolite transporter
MATNSGRALARRGLIFVVLAGMLWGTSGVATKAIYALADISAMSVAAFRLALGAPLLLLAYRWSVAPRAASLRQGLAAPQDGAPRRPARRSDLALLVLAGAALGLSQAWYFAAISTVGVTIATLVTICTIPVLVCLLAAALLGERLTAAVGGALACALAGTALMVGAGQGTGAASLPGSTAWGGIGLALASAASFAAFMLLSRRVANHYHPLGSITLAVAAGAALLLLITAFTTGLRVAYPWQVWALFLYLGLMPTALAYGLFYHGIQYATASEASIATLAEPLTSTILALGLFGERLGPQGWLGAALLIGVMALLLRRPGTSGRDSTPA